MKVTFLGTGTSHGVPMLGCGCPVCRSMDRRNNRTRASIWIQQGKTSVLIDTATELRIQALREGIRSVDLILQTHAHADHTHGLDDIRTFSYGKTIPVAGLKPVLDEMRERFSYIFMSTQKGGGKPDIRLVPVAPGKTTELAGFTFTLIPILHGEITIAGYRWGSWAYLTDCSQIPESSFKLLKGVQTLIIGALRYRPHSTHFNLEQALEAAEKIGAKRTYLTHMCHDLDHKTLEAQLPKGVYPAFDGLSLS